MEIVRGRTIVRYALTLALLTSVGQAAAADHGDAPLQANDRQGDIGDTFFFLDPNDNTRAVLAMTVQGFIVPGEAVNFGFFDQRIRYRFELETTGDASTAPRSRAASATSSAAIRRTFSWLRFRNGPRRGR